MLFFHIYRSLCLFKTIDYSCNNFAPFNKTKFFSSEKLTNINIIIKIINFFYLN